MTPERNEQATSGHEWFIDYLGLSGENVLRCQCGERLYPDCDISAASIADEFERHQRTAIANHRNPETSP